MTTAKKQQARFRPFLSEDHNANLEIRKITEEGLRAELNQEQKNMTFHEFLLSKREFYQSVNYTWEARDHKEMDEYWTTPTSQVLAEQPAQHNRTNQDKMVTVHLIAHSH